MLKKTSNSGKKKPTQQARKQLKTLLYHLTLQTYYIRFDSEPYTLSCLNIY